MNIIIYFEIRSLVEKVLVPHDSDVEKDEIENYFLYIDSIRFIELITTVENFYKIEIKSEDLNRNNTKSLEAFCQMVEKYLVKQKNHVPHGI